MVTALVVLIILILVLMLFTRGLRSAAGGLDSAAGGVNTFNRWLKGKASLRTQVILGVVLGILVAVLLITWLERG